MVGGDAGCVLGAGAGPAARVRITRAELVRYFTLTSAEIQQLRLSQRGVTAGETREHGLDIDGPTIG
ncbi:MAG TPA: hypothetical protein VNO54_07180 [Streptosporangiaceae bacterium]|nr:hypothetical protein [Streptosporangiaceae bacterium]